MIALPQLQPESNGSPCTPNQIAEMMTGRPHLSYSEARTFQACPLKWRYQYVERLKPERISSALLMGIGFHAGVEQHFQSLMAAEAAPSLDALMGAFEAAWSQQSQDIPVTYSKGQDYNTVADQARKMFEAFQSSEHASIKGQLIGLEEAFKAVLHPSLPDLAGRVDLLSYDEPANVLWITDYKTSRSLWKPEQAREQSAQLMLYAEGCKAIAHDLGAQIKLQFVVVTKTKEPKIGVIPVQLDPTSVTRTRRILKSVFDAMMTGVTYPAPSPMSCSTCGFRRRCDAW